MKYPKIRALRPSKEPHPFLPLSARSVFYNYMPPEKHEINPPKKMVQVYWCISGSATFRSNNSTWLLTENHTCRYHYETEHDIKAEKDGCEFYYWTFDGPLAAELIKHTHFQGTNTISSGPPPLDKLLLLESYIKDLSQKANTLASDLIYQLTMLASLNSHENQHSNSFVNASILYMKEKFGDADLNIEFISRKLQITRNHFCREFTKQQGITPSSYLKKIRLQNAMHLLLNSNFTITDIAKKCGFLDPNYFSRVLQKEINFSPSEYRLEHQ